MLLRRSLQVQRLTGSLSQHFRANAAQAELRSGETSTSESTATSQSGGGSAAEQSLVSEAPVSTGQVQEQQPAEHISTKPVADNTLPSPSSGRPRLKDSSLPPPQFIGKQRPPIDLGVALDEVKAGVRAKFDETVEVVMRLGTDPRRGDQQVRGAVILPHGTGKAVRVCVFAEGEAAELARQSGADLIGSEDILTRVREGDIDFDKCLATADMMPRLSKVARVLGPRGLMPNTKLGTLVDTAGLPAAIQAMKGGRVEYRADKTANVHAGIGKASFPSEHLYNNIGTFAGAILGARPKGVKGSGPSGYILSVYLSSTMGRGVPVTLPSVVAALQKARR